MDKQAIQRFRRNLFAIPEPELNQKSVMKSIDRLWNWQKDLDAANGTLDFWQKSTEAQKIDARRWFLTLTAFGKGVF